MKVRVLGCGTSTGVPRIGNKWGECDPAEPRNRRLRSSILLESGGKRLLVDCGPDLREQMLAAKVATIDALIVTHDHADHVHGIDDLRPLAQNGGSPIALYARSDLVARLEQRFAYAIVEAGLYPPVVVAHVLPDEMAMGEARLRFVDQPHGTITSLGLRIQEAGKALVYAIDFHDLTAGMADLYQGADVMICDCLMRRPHPTHAHLGVVLGWARDLKVGQLYLSHMGTSMDYRTLAAELPDWAAPAYDGLDIHL